MMTANILRLYSFLLIGFALNAHADTDTNKLPINWQELAKPYHSSSAVNPPRVIAKPKQGSLSVPPGFVVEEYLSGFERPRFMLLGPNNEILVSDMSAGIIYLITAQKARPLITSLNKPYGMALYNKDRLYVATADSVRVYVYSALKDNLGTGTEIIPLRKYASGHITRSLLIDETAEKLYLSVGSRSNVALGEPAIRAAISRYNLDGTGFELFATGIRNPIGLHWAPIAQADDPKKLWVTSHERDGLGDELVPDYFTSVGQGDFYGWPYAYIGPHEDPRHQGVDPDKVNQTHYPDVLLGSHVGAMDFTFYTATQFPEKYRNGAFVALHGSWNHSKRVGYKVVFIPFKDGQPLAGSEDFLTGWALAEDKVEVWGRPVGILQMHDGSILISDDGAGKIWRVHYTQ